MAFDLEKLKDKLLDKGLVVAEDMAEIVADCVFEWVEDGIKETETPYDDFVLPIMPAIKKVALGQIDKIDGVIEE